MGKMKISLLFKMKLLLLLLFVLSSAIVCGITLLFQNISLKLGMWIIVFSIIYTLILFFLPTPKNKYGKIIVIVYKIPFNLLYGLLHLIIPSIAIVSAYLFAVIFVAGVMTIIIVALKVVHVPINHDLSLFLLIAFTSSILSNYTDYIKHFIKKRGVFKIWSTKPRTNEIVDISMYMLQTENMHFLISFLYVIYLFTYAIYNIQQLGAMISPTIDDAILKAFLFYIAFTTMVKRYTETESESEELLMRILKLYHFPIAPKEEQLED